MVKSANREKEERTSRRRETGGGRADSAMTFQIRRKKIKLQSSHNSQTEFCRNPKKTQKERKKRKKRKKGRK